jgi:hypothetical protein
MRQALKSGDSGGQDAGSQGISPTATWLQCSGSLPCWNLVRRCLLDTSSNCPMKLIRRKFNIKTAFATCFGLTGSSGGKFYLLKLLHCIFDIINMDYFISWNISMLLPSSSTIRHLFENSTRYVSLRRGHQLIPVKCDRLWDRNLKFQPISWWKTVAADDDFKGHWDFHLNTHVCREY